MKIILFIFSLILISCGSKSPTPVLATSNDDPTTDTDSLSWVITDFPIKIRLNSSYEFDTDMINAFSNSIDRYNAVFSQDVFEIELGATPTFNESKLYLNDDITSVTFHTPWLTDQDNRSLAVTSYARIDNRIIKADIIFNTEYFGFAFVPTSGKIDLESTLTHELGHILGLGHVNPQAGLNCLDGSVDQDEDTCSIMNPNLGFKQVHRRLSPSDLDTLALLYPSLL